MKRFFLVWFLLLVFSSAVAHDLSVSQTNGPSAGAIKFGLGFSKSSPSTIYVDRYKSVDWGKNWNEMKLPDNSAVRAIAVSPESSEKVFIATSDALLKSTDGGKSWKNLGNIGNEEAETSAIAINPAKPSEIYLGNTHGEIFRTENSGESWSNISNRINVSSPISRITFNPENAGGVWIATGLWYWSSLVSREKTGSGLFKSSDGGKSFEKIENGFSNDLVQDVDVLGSTVFASIHHNPDREGQYRAVFRSADSGQTWKKVLENNLTMTMVAVNPENKNHVIVSGSNETPFFVSFDGGENWKGLSFGEAEHINYAHELEFAGTENVYAIDYYKPFLKSTNGGKTWEWSANGIGASNVVSLNVHPENRNAVIASTIDGAVHTTLDGGKEWERFLTAELGGIYWAAMVFHPQNLKKIFLGASGPFDIATGRYFGGFGKYTGLYVSSDGGRTAEKTTGLKHPLSSSNDQLEIYDVLVHPENPETILLGTSSEGVYKSTDGGKTWKEANNGIPRDGFYWQLNLEPEGYTPRENCEKEFEKFQRGERHAGGCFYFATRTSMSLFVNPHNKNEIWYTTLNGIFVSNDRGESWQWLSDDLKNIHTHYMAFDPVNPNTIYVGTHQGAIDEEGKVIDSSKGLLISRDGGKTWEQAENGPGQGYDIRAIAVSPKNTGFVAVGTNEEFFVSTDNGKNWKKIEGEKLKEANEIRIDSTAKIIYLGTGKTGVWRGIIDFEENSNAETEITGASFPKTVNLGEEFRAIVSLDNTGAKTGSMEVKLSIGKKELTETVFLPVASAEKAVFSLQLKEAGEQRVFVNGKEVGTIIVAGNRAEQKTTQKDMIQQKQETIEKQNKTPETAQEKNQEQGKEKNFLQAIVEAIISFFAGIFGK